MLIRNYVLSALLVLGFAGTAQSATFRTYDLSWSGPNSIFIEGKFSFDARLVGDSDGDGILGETDDNFIDEDDLATFRFTVFRSVPGPATDPEVLGSWDLGASSPFGGGRFQFQL